MKTIVIGAGYWGKNYIRELGHYCVGAIDINPSRLKEAENSFGVKGYAFSDKWPEFDAAIIATPPDTHIGVAKPILKKGKYVLIEKPFAISVEEALQLRKYKDKVMAGHIYLYHPEVENLRKTIEEVPIDHVFSRRTNAGPVRDWQDAMWDLAAHDISIFNYIFKHVPHACDVIKSRDWALLKLDYVAVNALIYVSWLGGPKTRTIELVPADRDERIVFDDLKVALEVSPMRRMLDDFLSGQWDEKCSFDAAIDVINVLESSS